MLRNYFKIALRNLRKHKGYALMNIAGLATGLACCWMILLFVQDELSFDRFHEHRERIYRVTLHGSMAGNEVKSANSPVPMAAALMSDYPEVVAATRIKPSFNPVLVGHHENQFSEPDVYFVDGNFFDIFSFALIDGNAQTALREPYSVVITEEMAGKYFGRENPIGKVLRFNNQTDFKVTGVVQNVPAQSHFQFDFLASFSSWDISRSTSWTSNHLYTYLLLQEGYDADLLAAKLPEVVRKYVGPQMEEGLGVTFEQFTAAGGIYAYGLQPIEQIHLHSKLTGELEPNGDIQYVTIFSLIAFFIMLLACINFMNLATARSARRAREVGLRKVVGSSRVQLVRQFLLESQVICAIALLLAIVLVELLLPTFNALSGKQFASAFAGGWSIVPILIAATLLVGLLSGSYPAFFLATLQPIVTLKKRHNPRGRGDASLRKALVIFQFAITIVLVSGTFVVYNQLQFIRAKQLGFEKERLLLIHRAARLGPQVEGFKAELRRQVGVVAASGTLHVPGREVWQNAYKIEGDANHEGYIFANLNVDHDFIETLGLEVVAGRGFSPAHGTDSTAFIVNEALVRKMGWQEPLGKIIINPGAFKGPIIGVVRDFHYASLHQEIQPAVLNLSHDGIRFVAVRLAPGQIQTTIANVRETWQQFSPGQPFDYSFLDADFDKLYQADQRIGHIAAAFSVLSIFIACLGLFGLASFSAEQRTKEIGVRKVLGATAPGIFGLLSREFVGYVFIGFVVAAPLAYVTMRQWLQDFAYRIELSWWIFALAGGLALWIALMTVSMQAIRAALANPMKALRYE